MLIEDECITAHTLYDQAGSDIFTTPSGSVVMATGMSLCSNILSVLTNGVSVVRSLHVVGHICEVSCVL